MDAEDLLFILYTSGTTGKPKGIVHTTGGYLTGAASTTKHVFDLREEDVFWCTADIGWVTGHSYLVYGPLANGATCVVYEGAPDWPEKDRFWQLCERYGVTIFYTAPTAIRAFMKWGAVTGQTVRPVATAIARFRWRADQPRSVDVVSRTHRQRTLPYRRYMVADGDGRDHDLAAAGRYPHQTRLGNDAVSRHLRRTRRCARQRTRKGRRSHGDHQAVAQHAAHDLGRRPALHRHVLLQVARTTRPVFPRRRYQAR